jgi:hypothetical protein
MFATTELVAGPSTDGARNPLRAAQLKEESPFVRVGPVRPEGLCQPLSSIYGSQASEQEEEHVRHRTGRDGEFQTGENWGVSDWR